ncbi:MAG: HD domain-containing phosphohydrolase [Chloroflexales bacterium]
MVEDERIVARDIQLILERSGYCVPAIAVSGEQAIAHAIQYQPDLVLMDIVLQGEMDGIQAANQINQHHTIPIIYLTAYRDEATVNRAKSSEPIAYVTKPYEERSLLLTIEIALNQYRRNRQRTEKDLRTSERLSQAALNTLTAHIALLNESGEIITVNQAWRDYAHANAPQSTSVFEGANYLAICDNVPVDSRDRATAQEVADGIRAVIRGELTRFHLDYGYLCALPSEQCWFDLRVTRFAGDGPIYVTVAHEDITPRKQAEIVLRDSKEQIRRQKERAETLAEISQTLSETFNYDQAIDLVASRVAASIGDLCIAMMISDDGAYLTMMAAHNRDLQAMPLARIALESTIYRLGEGLAGRVAQTGEPILIPETAPEDIRAMSNPAMYGYLDSVDVYGVLIVPIKAGGETLGVLGITRSQPGYPYTIDDQTFMQDIAHRAAQTIINARLYRNAQRRAQNLEALHAIDAAITSSLDLQFTLNVVVHQTVAQLGVSAATVLLLKPHTHTLVYAAGNGFRGKAIERMRVRLGVGYAGRAALERQIISAHQYHATDPDAVHTDVPEGEGFVCCLAAPLIAKGQVNGVLEVFTRTHHHKDEEWMGFFETLAQQTAIAIDSAQMFENLQRSNLDLVRAYDATIEGWSRAMDLRDRETEGHTRRVTELTERLARAMKIDEAEIVHIRRGALLHDMGKMGVPDAILLKPGKLTEEEWVIMRQHPQHAYDMLAPISYLRTALDIPYYHHEKWDGTGYPHGLKGEQIPLAARLFAVADVWDALRSDRPYRQGWPEATVHTYIRSLAGTHFEPKAVDLFFQVMHE